MKMTMELDAKSRRKFDALMREMARVTKRDMGTVTRNVGRDFVRNLIRYTPIGASRVDNRLRWHRGMAKAGWIQSLLIVGLQPGGGLTTYANRGGRRAGDMGTGRANLRNTLEPFIEGSNTVPFILDVERGTSFSPAARMLWRAARQTGRQMRRRLARMSTRQAGHFIRF